MTVNDIRFRISEKLTPAQGQRGFFICPLCKSGTGAKHSAAMKINYDGIHAKCFSCGFYGDIFDLTAAVDGTNLSEATRKLMEEYGAEPAEPKPGLPIKDKRPVPPPTADFSKYIDTCAARLPGSPAEDYLHGRGFTDETIRRFRLGYDSEIYFGEAKKRCAGIVIPYNRECSYYAARSITGKYFDKAKTAEAGEEPAFNPAAAKADVCFVVESQLDAITISQCGGNAIAIGGTGGVRKLMRIKYEKDVVLVLCMDNDDAGMKATAEASAALAEAGVRYIVSNISGDCKDPNELLQKDPDALIANIKDAESAARSKLTEAEDLAREEYQKKHQISRHIQKFVDGIADSANTPSIRTGFPKLDSALDGGLYEGLIVLGAISSLGKTTLAMQIADQIAQQGQDVLIFSLEMAQTQLMSKSISRHTLMQVLAGDGDTRKAKTARGITDIKRYVNYSRQELQIIDDAVSDYAKYSDHLYVIEAVGDLRADNIRQAVDRHVKLTGNRPVCILDYLQLVAADNDRQSDKQIVDSAVTALKQITRDYKVPLIAISSFNRMNYREAVSMESYKESGKIEYSSDVLIGLQLKGAGERDFDPTEAKKKDPREIELIILKNREAAVGQKVEYAYYPMFNYFVEK